MQDQLIDLLLTGTIDTLLMVGVSAFVAFLIGLPLAVILVNTSEQGIYPSKKINHALGTVINITRSVPFLILMVALIPVVVCIGRRLSPSCLFPPLSKIYGIISCMWIGR